MHGSRIIIFLFLWWSHKDPEWVEDSRREDPEGSKQASGEPWEGRGSLAIIRKARATGEGAGGGYPERRAVAAGCTVSHHHGLGQLIFCSRRQAVDTAVLYLTVRNSFH